MSKKLHKPKQHVVNAPVQNDESNFAEHATVMYPIFSFMCCVEVGGNKNLVLWRGESKTVRLYLKV